MAYPRAVIHSSRDSQHVWADDTQKCKCGTVILSVRQWEEHVEHEEHSARPFPPLRDLCGGEGELWPKPAGVREVDPDYQPTVFGELHADLDKRNELGFKIYGKALYAEDGRDWLQEAYEEVLDLAVYLKAQLMRRRHESHR